jgi:hypothetical protein
MKTVWTIVKWIILAVMGMYAGLVLDALPATLSLPQGRRPGIKDLTLAQAASQLDASGKSGPDLVEAARELVATRMQYCRRNSFDSPAKAFRRGYGYCVQQAYALVDLLARLGFEANVVHAFCNRFPDGTVGGHAWVRVTVDGEERDIDSLLYDAEMGELTFTSLTSVVDHTPLFKVVTQLGEAAVNAHRYYRTGKDSEL